MLTGMVHDVLVVEDEEDIALPLMRTLEREGYDVSRVSGGAEAVAFVVEDSPAVVILDLGLPDGHGLDLLPELTDEDGRTIPVVIYSAQDMDRQAAPAVQAVLTKSRMSLAQLASTVRRLTRRAGGRS